MNFNFKKFGEVLENAPEEVKNTFLSLMFSMGMSMKQLEEYTLKEKNVGIEQSISGGGNLSESFLNGKHNKQTQEYKQKFYSILREADRIAEQRFGNQYFSKNIDLLNEMGDNASNFNSRQNLLNEKTNKGLSYLVENKKSLINHDYEIRGQKPIYSTTIKLLKATDVLDDVDQYLSHIEVYNKYGSNVEVKLIFQNYNPTEFAWFKIFYNKYKSLIINKTYGVKFYDNRKYKEEYVSLSNLINEQNYDHQIVLTYSGVFIKE